MVKIAAVFELPEYAVQRVAVHLETWYNEWTVSD